MPCVKVWLAELKDDIKSCGKFTIFTRLKIGEGGVSRSIFSLYKTKDRGGGVSRSIFSLVKIVNLP